MKRRKKVTKLQKKRKVKKAKFNTVQETITQNIVQEIELTEDSKKVIDYLENEILPQARQSSFKGMVPLMVDGKMEFKEVSSVAELERIIDDLKGNKTKLAVSGLPTTNLPEKTESSQESEERTMSRSEQKRLELMKESVKVPKKKKGLFNKIKSLIGG
jgi:hypothetical protein